MNNFRADVPALHGDSLDRDGAATPDTIECPFDLDQPSEVDRKLVLALFAEMTDRLMD